MLTSTGIDVILISELRKTIQEREIIKMTNTYSEELLAVLDEIFFNEDEEFEFVEETFFYIAREGGMTEDEAIAYWNELSF